MKIFNHADKSLKPSFGSLTKSIFSSRLTFSLMVLLVVLVQNI